MYIRHSALRRGFDRVFNSAPKVLLSHSCLLLISALPPPPDPSGQKLWISATPWAAF